MAKFKIKKYLITFEVGSITMRGHECDVHIFSKAKKLVAEHPELGVSGKIVGFERV